MMHDDGIPDRVRPGSLQLDAAIFFTVVAGKITRVDEYVDSAATRRLFALLPRPAA